MFVNIITGMYSWNYISAWSECIGVMIRPGDLAPVQQGLGLLAPFVNFSVSKIFDFTKIHARFL